MQPTTRFTKALGAAVAVLVLATSFPPAVSSQSDIVWQQTNGPYGGFVLALAVNASGHVFAGTDHGGGVFRSTNNGDTWVPINTGLTNPFGGIPSVSALAVNASGHVFAGADGGGVFRAIPQ